MQVKASLINQLLGGELVGNPDVLVSKPAKIEAGEPGAISFLGNLKYESYVYTCQSSVILVAKDFEPKQNITATLIKVADVYASLGILMQYFSEAMEAQQQKEISKQAYIHEQATVGEGARVDAFAYIEKGAKIGKNAVIYPHVYIGEDVVIGDDVTLHSGVKIYRGCQLGNQVTVHANAVIGSDGFGFAPQADGSYQKIPQLGIVILGDRVDVGANTVIDRATMDATIIEEGVKLDNLIQVAHNVRVGKNTVLASQVGVAGSTQIGENCMVGGQVGFAGHLKIANGTKIQAQSGLAQSVKQENTAIWGSPAIDYKRYYRCAIVFKNLPDLQKQVDQIQKQLNNLTKKG
ncbi:UDP-3-O-(3-hydroxymyristoyl)glucosamine N-acyltransferase [Aureispira anguillae]|uniref:UDP-3-O-acylglucosamine N-acyltransferase n=1 Tax=Aureispira anguillae TaxID=2864201 RepID=A0A915YG40_9BACT|nr:UDP-3-O-(3-hydroxymyristoyl)glucosamine N-acyltransferase [Aureispira anguillae]BDS12508.1 UDP-3-O-(3-hydroxymyristoyl)glucosamine N-acyltransferase [Aureispira anguillae]